MRARIPQLHLSLFHQVATAIRGAIILAKLSIVPVRRGYWGNKIGKPHTVPCKVTGQFLHHFLLVR